MTFSSAAAWCLIIIVIGAVLCGVFEFCLWRWLGNWDGNEEENEET